ncbi:MAG: aminotransferase class I/II-fold pyridoxal phosphate-dependent enzyme [candidate division NC10 bacterium]|nr:aminotransferase class I/II-fold pyridoxal phosphate-dependent enzyme [candidate division NC10 bacterium]
MELYEKCRRFTAAQQLQAAGYYPYFRRIESAQEPEVIVDGRKMIMIGSNNYLGLATHPKVKEAARKALDRYGTSCAGSRFLNGTLDLHEELERKIAAFKGKEAALVFSTGFQTNLGVISALVGKGDAVITDRWDHASILDGCRLSYGRTQRFRHNDMEDLERVLASTDAKGKLIVIDGVFSMEGDLADLPAIVGLAKRYGARVMVDDAHATGVLGPHGRGTAEHFGLEDEVDLIMGTCSKALASIGGFIAGKEVVINYIKHYARSMIFSASLPPPCIAAISAALDIIQEEPERRQRLWEHATKMREGLRSMGYDTGKSQTPVVPVVVGDDRKAFELWRFLHEHDVFANPAVSPAVPKGRALIRTSYMATHTTEQLDWVLEVFYKAGKKLALI